METGIGAAWELGEYRRAAQQLCEFVARTGIEIPFSKTALESVREAFLQQYAPERLLKIPQDHLLETLFYTSGDNRTSLCYWLERNAEGKRLFGSIAGGSAYKFGLFQRQSTGEWVTGSPQKPRILNEEEALRIGGEIRNALVIGAQLIGASNPVTVGDYEQLDHTLERAMGKTYYNLSWVHKYLSIVCFDKLSGFHTPDWQRHMLNALKIRPSKKTYGRSGQLSIVAREAGWYYPEFYAVMQLYEKYDHTREDAPRPLIFQTPLTSKYEQNRIVFGAPGTGKSYRLKMDCEVFLSREGGAYERVTFHPDYTYAQFVGTYKPVSDRDAIRYAFVPGPFLRLYAKALQNARTDAPKPHILIIEEINRARAAAVFGDVFQLLDRDENGVSEYAIQTSEEMRNYLASVLGGEARQYEQLRLPNNFFLWATMNSADQGVFAMDTAFRRRWEFEYLGIDENEPKQPIYAQLGGKEPMKIEWNTLRRAINEKLSTVCQINEDKLIGPFFLSQNVLRTDADGMVEDGARFCSAFQSKVLMYLYEDAVRLHRKRLFEGCDCTRYSAVCAAFVRIGLGIFGQDFVKTYYEPQRRS